MALCAYSTPFEFVSFWPSHHFYYLRVCLILLYVLIDVYLLWHEGCVSSRAHTFCLLPLLGLGIAWAKAFIFPPSPCFSFSTTVGLLATNFAISLHHECYNFTSLFISCYLVGLWTDAPVVSTLFFINLLFRASLAHLPHLYLFRALLIKKVQRVYDNKPMTIEMNTKISNRRANRK